MECTEIRERLSEYIDGFMDAETEALVRRHLASCEDCSRELASMKSLVRELGDLDPVEAPADFLARLHEKMEQPAGFSKILHALFRPFRIKIPLQFAGAAVAAVLVFIVLNVQQPKEQFRPRPLPAKQEEIAREMAPAAPTPHRSVPSKRAKIARNTTPVVPEQPAVLKAPSHPATVEEMESDRTAAKAAPIEMALVIRRDRPMQRGSVPPAASEAVESIPAAPETKKGRMVDGQYPRKSTRKGSRALEEEREVPVALGGSTDSFKDLAAPAPPDLKQPLSRVQQLVTMSHGKVLSVEQDEDTLSPRSILVGIPSDRLWIFYSGLKAMGRLEPPPPTHHPDDTGKMIQMRIRFLYPE